MSFLPLQVLHESITYCTWSSYDCYILQQNYLVPFPEIWIYCNVLYHMLKVCTSCIWKVNVLQRWHSRSNSVLRIHDLSVYWKEVPLTSVRVFFMPCRQSLEPLWQPLWLKGEVLHVIGPAVYQTTDIHGVCTINLSKNVHYSTSVMWKYKTKASPRYHTPWLCFFASQIPADKAVCLIIGYKVLPQRL